uniref:Uncharacterized protein n=1 Tax=Peronospora matthiolae TaxID=2874970 RepID=A0AAV1VG40_9STRA
MSPPSHPAVEPPLPSGSTSPQLTPLRSATPAFDDEDYTGLKPDATEPDQAGPAPADHLADPVSPSVGYDDAPTDDASSADAEPADADVGSEPVRNLDTADDPVRNLDTAESYQAGPAPADHLADPVGFSVGSDDAPADDASSADADPADADVNNNQVRNLDTGEPDQASPAPAEHLADPVDFSVGSDDAPADDASSADADPADADVNSNQVGYDDTPADDASSADSDVCSDQVHDVDTTEVDQLAKECEDLRRAVAESEQRVASLRIVFDALARSFAQRGRELDQLKTERALRHQELHRLRSSHAAHIEELALLRTERDMLTRDRQAQLNHLVNFVMGLPPSVGLAYDKRPREHLAADPVPPPEKRARVTVTSSSASGSPSAVVALVDHVIQHRSASNSPGHPRVAVVPNSPANPSSMVPGPACPTNLSRSESNLHKSRQASRPRLDVPKIPA